LPVPALDGGRLLFLVIEAIRRKPMDPAYESRVHYAGFVVLITLILIITFNDISRLQTPFASLVSQCQ
jgi:regulator of sigma E protease